MNDREMGSEYLCPWEKPRDHYRLFPEAIDPVGSKDSQREGRRGGKVRSESRGKIFILWTNPVFTCPLKKIKIPEAGSSGRDSSNDQEEVGGRMSLV